MTLLLQLQGRLERLLPVSWPQTLPVHPGLYRTKQPRI